MHISAEVLKETTLADGSELKLTENSLIHIGSFDNSEDIGISFLSDLSPTSNKDNSLTDISLESIDAVQYSSHLQPRLELPSFVVGGLSVLVSLYCWYNFGMNDFAIHWAALGVVVLLLGLIVGWALREHVFVEQINVHTSSGEKFKYTRNVDESPENAQVELLWIVQELRQHSYK